MKKFGIILLALFVWIGVSAKTQSTGKDVQATDTVVVTADSASATVATTNDFIDTVVEKAITAKIGNIDNDDTQTTGFVGMVLFLVIGLPIFIIFLAVVLIVYFSTKSQKEREKIRHDVYLKSLDAGQPLPEKFFDEPERKSSNLKRGAMWSAVGLAIVIGFWVSGDTDALFLGIIPAFVGAAYLLVYFIEDKNCKSGNQ